MKNNFSLCADDFGQDPYINEAILGLFNSQRMSATSVLIDANLNSSCIADLQTAYKKGLQVGLHFNLTHYFPNFNSTPLHKPLYHWIFLSQCGLLPAHRIQQSFTDQLTKFEDELGFTPDFIDGHQHVHQFHGIGSIIINTLLQRYQPSQMPWIRNTLLPMSARSIPEKKKCLLLQYLGGNDFYQRLKQAHLSTNNGFLGVYNFNLTQENAYRRYMQAWFANVRSNSLIMCHPATNEVAQDAIGKQRPIEYRYFKSDAFVEDLEKYQLHLSPPHSRYEG